MASTDPWTITYVKSKRHFPWMWSYDQMADKALLPVGQTEWNGTEPLVRIEFEESPALSRIFVYAMEFESRRVARPRDDDATIVELIDAKRREAYAEAVNHLVKRKREWQSRMGIRAEPAPRRVAQDLLAEATRKSAEEKLMALGLGQLASFSMFMTRYDPETLLNLAYGYARNQTGMGTVRPHDEWIADLRLPPDVQQRAVRIPTLHVSLAELVPDPVVLLNYTRSFQDFQPRRRVLMYQQESIQEIRYPDMLGATGPLRLSRNDLVHFENMTDAATAIVLALCGRVVVEENPLRPLEAKADDWAQAVQFIRQHHLPELPPLLTL